jgi:hypothetical protein
MQMHAERRHQKAAAEAACPGKHRAARADAFKPLASKRRRQAEKHDRQGEDPAERGQRPVVRASLDDADHLGERTIEDGEGLRLTDAQMNGERCGFCAKSARFGRLRHGGADRLLRSAALVYACRATVKLWFLNNIY